MKRLDAVSARNLGALIVDDLELGLDRLRFARVSAANLDGFEAALMVVRRVMEDGELEWGEVEALNMALVLEAQR